MRSTLFSTAAIVGSLTMGLSSVSFGEDHNQATTPAAKQGMANSKMTPEIKKDMADMYQKMADCLRTDKSLDQCSHAAMTHCPVVEKTGHCPINEGTNPVAGKRMKHPMGNMGGKGTGNMKDNHPVNGGE